MAMAAVMEGIGKKIGEALAFIRERVDLNPRVCVVLGTGLKALIQRLRLVHSLNYAEIPHLPCTTVETHEGRLLFGECHGQPLAVMHGRYHYYEGYSTSEITFPLRVMKALGAETVILCNAAGGLNPLFEAGDIMAIVDHIHLIPENPLRGMRDEALGSRFPDMSRAYDRGLVQMAEKAALTRGFSIKKGIYVGIPGPSLETAAETRMLRSFGADAVGMSTTPEVIVAVSMGMRVLGLSVISNVNRPDAFQPILLEKIIDASRKADPRLAEVVEGVVRLLAEEDRIGHQGPGS